VNHPTQPANHVDPLHARFLSIVPRIRLHGRIYFRHLRCYHRKQEALAEMVAICWAWFVRLSQLGKDPLQFPFALASFAAKQVRSGRKLTGIDKAKDVLSPRAQQEKDFVVSTIPDVSSLNGNIFDETLTDNTQTPVDEQVAFRLDFPTWRLTRTDRDRRVIDDLMIGERTSDVAARYGLSPARISQLRRDFMDDWNRFHGELPSKGNGSSSSVA
jgi:hypothetical protein